MSTPTTTNVLITGANKGIGLAIARLYLSRPNHVVIAAVRDLSKATEALSASPAGANSKFIPIRIDAFDHSTPASATASLRAEHAITHIDIVYANAGLAHYSRLHATTPQQLSDMATVNGVAVLALYQAIRPFFAASSAPIQQFIHIGSAAGSVTTLTTSLGGQFPNGGYGASKSFAEFIVRKIAVEAHEFDVEGHGVPNLVAWSVHPGLVETDMSAAAVEPLGLKNVEGLRMMKKEESGGAIVKLADGSSWENRGAGFFTYDGSVCAW